MMIPKDVLESMRYEFARAGLDCDDNYRAYRIKDSFGKSEFMTTRKRGCCGCYEISIIDENHDKWMVGCNYGH